MPIIFYIVPALCFKEILVSVPRRWRDNMAEICRSYVKIVSINYGIVHLLMVPALLTYLYGWFQDIISSYSGIQSHIQYHILSLIHNHCSLYIFLSSFRIFSDSTSELVQQLRITKRILKLYVYIHILIHTTNFS